MPHSAGRVKLSAWSSASLWALGPKVARAACEERELIRAARQSPFGEKTLDASNDGQSHLDCVDGKQRQRPAAWVDYISELDELHL